jgi:hypothetical protein
MYLRLGSSDTGHQFHDANEIVRLNGEIPLPVVDVISRRPLATADYGQSGMMWT